MTLLGAILWGYLLLGCLSGGFAAFLLTTLGEQVDEDLRRAGITRQIFVLVAAVPWPVILVALVKARQQR